MVRRISFPASQLQTADLSPIYLFLASVTRLALIPFTLSNGVTIPAGTYISIAGSATHRDERIYPNPKEFDGFRFAKLRESEADASAVTSRHQVISISSENLTFGLGRHAW
jgi:cytochrome P450